MSDSVVQSIVFGFGFRARCGKDTVAQMIKEGRGDKRPCNCDPADHEFVGYDIRIYSFAKELKREVNECAEKSGGMIHLFDDGLRTGGFLQENGNILALPEWVQYDPEAPTDDPDCPYGKQRTLLQWYGSEYRRSINPDYWVSKVAKRIAAEKPEVAILTDMRFPNEMAFVQKYGEAIRVDRPNLPALQGAAGIHQSELALANVPDENWDAIITNNGTLEELRENALFTFDMLMSIIPVQR